MNTYLCNNDIMINNQKVRKKINRKYTVLLFRSHLELNEIKYRTLSDLLNTMSSPATKTLLGEKQKWIQRISSMR